MRTLEGSNRVRNGLMGILILVARHRRRAELRQRADAVRDADVLRAVLRHRRPQHRRQGAHRRRRRRRGAQSMEIDGDKVVIGYSLDGTQIGTESRAAIRTDTILGRRNIEIEPRGSDGVARQRNSAAGPDHHAVPDLRRVLRRDQGGVGLGHPDGEEVAERAVGDHRPDLSAPECRARRGGAVLRHHRQARRPDQATAGQRQQDRRHPRQPQRADQQAVGQRPDAAGRDQRAQLRGQHAARAGRLVLRTGARASSTTTRTSTTCSNSCAPSATSWSSADST